MTDKKEVSSPPTKYETTSLSLSGIATWDIDLLQKELELRAADGWVLAGSFAIEMRVYRTWAYWEQPERNFQ